MKHNRTFKNASTRISLSNCFLQIILCLFVLSGTLAAQQEVTTDTSSDSTGTGTAQDQTSASEYDVKSSIEIGARGKSINGNLNKYRSDLNYGAGARLFDSSVLITAKESDGKPFDSLFISGSGWNADPNGVARFKMEKNGWYTFDSSVRRFSYFNNLSNIALNQHTRNSKRNIGDFDVTILPQNDNLRFRVGYSFNTQGGPAALTYDYDRDEFPIKSTLKSRADDFRFGVDGTLLGFNLSFTEGYRRFDDKTDFFTDMLQLGNNPNPNSSISTFSRIIPEKGESFYHSLTAHRNFEKRFDFTGRIIYSTSKSSFSMVEELTGRDRSGNTVVLDRSDSSGETKRPNTNGDLGMSVFVTDKFTITNTFSVNSYRISGGNILLEVLRRNNSGGTPLPTTTANSGVYRFTNFRRYINTLEGSYDLNRFFTFYLGYRYTHRSVTLEGLDTNILTQASSSFTEDASNTTNSVIAGFKASPIPRKWTIFFDIEHGQADNAFTRLGNYDSTNVRFRSRIQPVNDFSLNFTAQVKSNKNPSQSNTTPPTSFNADVDSKNFGAFFDWNPDPRATISGGYSHYRVDSITAVIFPVTGTGIGQGLSRYKLRNNFFNLDGWFRPHKVVSFFASYRISKDTGQGDFFSITNYLIDGNYPISFQSPEARLTFRVHDRADLNLGYQYYNYNEKIVDPQNYNAHLPYVSLRIYLGRKDR